jgi:hypothetical protein
VRHFSGGANGENTEDNYASEYCGSLECPFPNEGVHDRTTLISTVALQLTMMWTRGASLSSYVKASLLHCRNADCDSHLVLWARSVR